MRVIVIEQMRACLAKSASFFSQAQQLTECVVIGHVR